MDGLGSGIDTIVKVVMVLLLLAVPLALWKLIDIGVWLLHHVHVGVS